MTPKPHKDRVEKLRTKMMDQALDGFIIPMADEFQGEYVALYAERLSWISGFTGSSGFAIILKDKAVVMSDGRYTLQLAQQVDQNIFEIDNFAKKPLTDWLKENTGEVAVIGYDPHLHTGFQIQGLKEKLQDKAIKLQAVENNLVDQIWEDQPARPKGKISLFPESVAGRSYQEKCSEISETVRDRNCEALILTQPDSVAWLLNIRGSDIPYVPVALSYAFVHADGMMDWFVDPDKLDQDVQEALQDKVIFQPPSNLEEAVNALIKKAKDQGQKIWLDTKRSARWFQEKIQAGDAEIHDEKDPCILPKACKTEAEQKAMEDVHIRDGVALTRFLHWFDQNAENGDLDELQVVEKLESFRKQHNSYLEPSFDTISGWGPNGAVIHYRVTEETNLKITPPGLMLVDSGAQYKDGTTDVTRTMAVGEPSAEMKERYTLVLKGHIAVSKARFPQGTTGAQIDILARKSLWDHGLDFAHGTGHGVGCYLSVHEEATSISPRETESFLPGMIVSNEPGYYKPNAYGIRIENLIVVRETNQKSEATDQPLLEFKTLTLAPMDRRLIVIELLNKSEIDWLNDYHAFVYKTLSPLLEQDVAQWLKEKTKPIG